MCFMSINIKLVFFISLVFVFTNVDFVFVIVTCFCFKHFNFNMLSLKKWFFSVTTIVEKYFKKGSLVPANCLFMYYLAEGQTEKAKEIYQKYSLASASRIMFKTILRRARRDSNPKLVEDLLSILENAVSNTPETKSVLYSNLINIHGKCWISFM